jgi:hypothetical protein
VLPPPRSKKGAQGTGDQPQAPTPGVDRSTLARDVEDHVLFEDRLMDASWCDE